MAIRSDEIISIIKSQIESFDATTETRSVGTVVEVGDGIAQIYGLDAALASEMLEFPGGVMGLALNLEEETVGAVILGDPSAIKEGDKVRTTGRVVEVPVGAALLGRVVDPLGNPLDGKGQIPRTTMRPVERIAPGVITRQSVDTPVQTGIKADRRPDPDRPRPARADHRRPPDRQDRDRDRHDHQPEGRRPRLHLRRDRPEALDRRADRRDPREVRRDGAHDRRRRRRRGSRPAPVPRPVLGRRDGRGDHGERRRGGRPPDQGRAVRLRRPVQARVGVPRDVAAAAPPARSRGVPGRRLLPPQPPARAGRAPERRERRRLADGAADHRDAGQRRVGVHPDQRDLDHGRPDLPRDRPVQRRPAARPEHRHLGVARRLGGPDQGHEAGRRSAQARPRAVPRPRGLRAVRERPRQGDPRPAEPRREAVRDPQAAAVPAAAGREAGRDPRGRDQRQARRRPDRRGSRTSRSASTASSRPSARRSSTSWARPRPSRRSSSAALESAIDDFKTSFLA